MSEILPWLIELWIGSKPLRVRLESDSRLIIGRTDKSSTKQPDVDLASFGAEEQGVSRQHIAFQVERDQLQIIDLHSGNGTLLNNTRLEPERPYPLKSGDQIRLAHLVMTVRVLVASGQTSVLQKQEGIEVSGALKAGSGETILIVEDHAEVAKVVSLVLEKAGYKTQVVHDVARALRVFNKTPPGAVILDLMLPDMNGLEFCRYVRRNVKHNTVPIIVVSAATAADNIAQAMQAGADIFLSKPVNTRELRQVLSSLLSRSAAGADSLLTRQLVGTAPLQAIPPDSRSNSVVLFVAGYSDNPLTITVNQPVAFGRGAEMLDRTYIDLTRFNAMDYGVSRVHMMLSYQDRQFYVEDQNSVNGTYLNGDPLRPHQPTPLNNGDEIRLGQLRMYIYFLTDPESVGAAH